MQLACQTREMTGAYDKKKTVNRQKNNNECYVVTQTYLKAFD